MATVPTGKMERELRALYLRWVKGMPSQENVPSYIDWFQTRSESLIADLGGQAAARGAFLDFPAPKRLDLNPVVGYIYDEMKQAAVQAGIMTGLNAKDMARAMLDAGMDKSYRKLERFARTETVRAYWKNSWDSVEGLGLVMVWSAERGPRTCQWCLDRDGMVVTSRSIMDHPNGRCTLLPKLPKQVDYKGAIEEDGTITESREVVQVQYDPERYVLNADGTPMLNGKGEPTTRLVGSSPLDASVKPTASAPSPTTPVQQVVEYPEYKYSELPSRKSMRAAGELTQAEDYAVDMYQGSQFANINEYLRTGVLYHDDVPQWVSGLDSVMQRTSLPGGVVQRGQALEELAAQIGFDMDNPAAVVGKSFSNPGYTSASVRDRLFDAAEFEAKQLQMEITVAPGTSGFTTGGVAGERELLLDRGLDFTIVGVEVEDELVYMKVIVSGGANS